ncbi:MAG: class I mannose-6-phosphate isomerase [Firmicutes bacterium]|nr:class I mannose-6-phosphate isomerase [Bacillota bacterium]
MIYLLKENRVRRSYIGGARIDRFYGRSDAKNGYYPEDWIGSVVEAKNPQYFVSKEGLSYVEEGILLRDIISCNPQEVIGMDKMPILLKMLDSAERLVIQAHPTVQFAKKNFSSDFGKTECWYFIECEKDACVYIGFKPNVTKERWKLLFEKQDAKGMLNCLHRFSVKPGDFVFVDGGVPHAIGGGSLMLELQEPTDLMVCAERVTPSGVALSDEKVHGGLGFDLMLDCFEYKNFTEEEAFSHFFVKPKQYNTKKVLIDSDITNKFNMSEIYCGEHMSKNFMLAIVVNGEGNIVSETGRKKIKKGDRLFISKGEKFNLEGTDFRVIVCEA